MAFLRRILEERWLYAIGWLGLATGLALGRAIISIAVIVLVGAWLFDGIYRKDFASKWKSFLNHRPALLLSSIPLVYVLSLVYSSGVHEGLSLLKTQIPLLVLPMVFSSMPRLKSDQVRSIVLIHIAALILSTVLSYVQSDALQIIKAPRSISLFVNHIRLSLMLVMAIVLILRFDQSRNPVRIAIKLAVISWFLYFLWITEAATGFAVLFLLVAFFGLRSMGQKGLRRWVGIAAILFLIGSVLWVSSCAKDYWKDSPIDLTQLETHSEKGNAYTHDLENGTLENGNRIWIYIADEELMEAWKQRSSMDPTQEDLKGQPLRGTLYRYLTSLGLRKDASGIAALKDEQIKQVEMGMTSATAFQHSGIRKRLDVLFFEVDSYLNGGDPSYNSLTRRIEFWKAGWGLFTAKPIMGVGAGNLREELKQQYVKEGRLSSGAFDLIHNQFLTFLACFGLVGFLWILYVHYWPLTLSELRPEPLYLAFLLVLSISYLNEDTLNTQAGISFFYFYQGLIVLGIYRPTHAKTVS